MSPHRMSLPSPPKQVVGAAIALQGVVAGAAVERVVAQVAEDVVGAGIAVEQIAAVAGQADQPDGIR